MTSDDDSYNIGINRVSYNIYNINSMDKVDVLFSNLIFNRLRFDVLFFNLRRRCFASEVFKLRYYDVNEP